MLIMTKDQRQQSLVNARRACLLLAEYATGDFVIVLGDDHRQCVADLLEQFGRLDKNARRPRAGRPRIETDNKKTLAQRRWRDKQK